MNRPDFDEFAALWQDEPDPLAQAQMEADARRARRRGRLFDFLEYVFGILLVGIFIGGAFISTSPLTMVVAVPLMLGIGWLTWRRRALRQMARTLNTSDRAGFIDSSMRNARADLRRNTMGLAFLPLLVPIAFVFKVSLRTGGGVQAVLEALTVWMQTPRAPITIGVLIVIAGFTIRSRRRIHRELERLERLRIGYEIEAEHEREL
jgi:F0F1-type ATP synthase assembly protein I